MTTIKVAHFFKLPKETVVISSLKKCFLPVYETFITIGEKTHKINVNAYGEGNIVGVEDVADREKGFIELTKEALEELSTPKGWVNYSKGIVNEVGKSLSGNQKETTAPKEKNVNPGFDLSFFASKWFIVLIMILGLFLIYLALFVK